MNIANGFIYKSNLWGTVIFKVEKDKTYEISIRQSIKAMMYIGYTKNYPTTNRFAEYFEQLGENSLEHTATIKARISGYLLVNFRDTLIDCKIQMIINE